MDLSFDTEEKILEDIGFENEETPNNIIPIGSETQEQLNPKQILSLNNIPDDFHDIILKYCNDIVEFYEIIYEINEHGLEKVLEKLKIRSSISYDYQTINLEDKQMYLNPMYIRMEMTASAGSGILVTGQYKCLNKKCGSDTIYVISEQLRSGDEAETQTLICPVCGTRWKL